MSNEVTVINDSTVLDDITSWRIAWMLWYQCAFQFGPAWKISCRVAFLPKGSKIPAGASVLHLLDTSDVEGALGYHDEEGNEVPYGRVFCKTAKDNGIEPSEVASHEFLELLADQHVNLTALDPAHNRLYALEVGDPVQSNGYQIGSPGQTLTAADFALPNYFDPNTPASKATSFRGSIHGPFTIAPQGYMSYIDLTKYSDGWKSEMGAKRSKLPVDLDDRLSRRAGPPSTA